MSEKLAMLTAKTVNPEGSGQGKGEITPQMVAAELHHLDRDVCRYAFLKYALDQTEKVPLYESHYCEVVNIALMGCWRLKAPESTETLGKLSDLALEESISPSVCSACNGAGVINNKGPCDVCKGTGSGRDLSIRKIAARLKVSKHRAEFFWQDKLRILLSKHQEWEQEIHSALKRLNNS